MPCTGIFPWSAGARPLWPGALPYRPFSHSLCHAWTHPSVGGLAVPFSLGRPCASAFPPGRDRIGKCLSFIHAERGGAGAVPSALQPSLSTLRGRLSPYLPAHALLYFYSRPLVGGWVSPTGRVSRCTQLGSDRRLPWRGLPSPSLDFLDSTPRTA